MAVLPDVLKNLEEQHQLARESVRSLSPEDLDWRSEHVRNSLVALGCHITGSEGYWIREVLGGEPQNRNRDAEFTARGLDAEEIVARIDRTASSTREFLEEREDDLLLEKRTVERNGKTQTYRASWVLMHVLVHTAYHAGQMNVIRKMRLDAAGIGRK